MKDYYQILGVDKSADEEEIRKCYRKLAMDFHPDRNPDKPEAEENFKEIAEAYGVLTDPVKRREYDVCMAMGGAQSYQEQGGFSYSQEDILQDLFKDPRFQQMFHGILREFQRSGLRAGPHFLKQSFFGGRGRLIFGGIFFIGSLAGPALLKGGKRALPSGKAILKNLGSSIGDSLGRLLGSNSAKDDIVVRQSLDITYQTPLSSEDLEIGKWTEVILDGKNGRETLKVKIPAGSKYGQKLRLKGRGLVGPEGRGDLFLQLCQK